MKMINKQKKHIHNCEIQRKYKIKVAFFLNKKKEVTFVVFLLNH